ncbi:hypothetical protein RSOLAG22IIIB_12567 [Rhizoctonia solani]|uniref:Uncharacterized protein n=1 Tax=Rhizoctonia solani TaxID=456999 RepID=A0A0K6GEW4_9AGAM|nr:hypothetical protein RSOLAG22IIIB_12567 [Rhizoctonia solani]
MGCDMPVQWSPARNMLRWYLELYPTIVEYAFRAHQERRIPILSHTQYEVLQDIVAILEVAHSAQELLSAEKTSTLALAFPVYQMVINAWDKCNLSIPEFSHAMEYIIHKTGNYVSRDRDAPVHTLAMATNPAFKLHWICAHCTYKQAQEAELILKCEMLSMHWILGSSSSRSREANGSATNATQAQR